MEDRCEISPVPKERYREFVDFFYSEFFPREPLALASGLAEKTNSGTVDTFMEWLDQQLSLAIIDSETNQIVAGVLNCYLKKSETLFDSEYSCMQSEDRVIWTFLDHLEEGIDVFEEAKADIGMELVFLCVRSGFEKRGFARRLTEATTELAKQLKIRFIKSNPTAPGKHSSGLRYT